MSKICRASKPDPDDDTVIYETGDEMAISVKDGVDTLVRVLKVLVPFAPGPILSELEEILLALQQSPAMIEYLQKKLDSDGDVPAGVLTIEQVPQEAQDQVVLAIKWDGSRIKKILENLPAIIALIKALSGGV